MAPYYYDRLTNYLSESQPVKLYDSVIRRSFSSTQDLVSRYNPHSSLSVYYPESKSLLRRSRSVDYISTNPFYPITHAIPDYPMRRYDLYVPGTWSYPIWKYLYEPTSYYSTPLHTRYYEDYRSRFRYPLSTYYLAGELDYYCRDLNRTLNRYNYLRYRYHTLYPTYRFYYGTGLHSLRHYVGYRSYPNYYTIYTYWY
ncbi:hypothetical protein T12_14956 [Trichinella patagoniensis]|uniref:Uncharacterized protein n=1 Tax=Trichinella patagoniensis TaxID=990121 RepID=A0A0V1A7B6_9BILA|nr:hypothetical protein T12_14956 [Trichinella patagoniensis]